MLHPLVAVSWLFDDRDVLSLSIEEFLGDM